MKHLLASLAILLSAGQTHAQIFTDKISADPLKAAQFNTHIEKAQLLIGHWASNTQVDILRARQAAGFELSKLERVRLGEAAFNRGCAIEAEAALAPLVATGEFGGARDSNRKRNAYTVTAVKLRADAQRNGELQNKEKLAPQLATGEVFISIGEAWFGAGDYAKAASLIQQGIAKGGIAKEDAPFAQLQLGIAQYRSRNVSAARATWSAIRSDRGARELAQAWLVIAAD